MVEYQLQPNQYYVPTNKGWISIFWLFLIIIIITGLLVWLGNSNKTISRSPNGSPCNQNNDCQNNACGRQTAANDAPLICCPSGSTDRYGNNNYCTQMSNGSECWFDSMCASGYCQGSNSGLQKGICQNPLISTI